MTSPHLLLAGIPGTGKTTYAGWLAETHGWKHLDADEVFPNSPTLTGALQLLLVDPSDTTFVDVLRALGPRVVLDWGFPTEWLPAVSALSVHGFTPWWFDGDVYQARASWLARVRSRHGSDMNCDSFNSQVQSILNNWPAIQAVFGPRIVHALRSDGTRPAWSEVMGWMSLPPGSDSGRRTGADC